MNVHKSVFFLLFTKVSALCAFSWRIRISMWGYIFLVALHTWVLCITLASLSRFSPLGFALASLDRFAPLGFALTFWSLCSIISTPRLLRWQVFCFALTKELLVKNKCASQIKIVWKKCVLPFKMHFTCSANRERQKVILSILCYAQHLDEFIDHVSCHLVKIELWALEGYR